MTASRRRWLVGAGFGVSALAGAALGLLFVSTEDLPQIREADIMQFSTSAGSKLYDSAEPPELIAQLSTEQRTFVPFTRLPRALVDATVAIEDERFYSHWGIDFYGIVRAALVNLVHWRKVEGASTITQQLARTLFLTHERTVQRKLKEMILAIKIEHQYKKEEILEMYLNQIFFGHGAYGVEQAARAYFGKHVEELTLPECALLAGMPKAPNEYSPRTNPERSRVRRDLVLTKMAQNGFIPRTEADEAKKNPIHLAETEITNAPYFASYVRQSLENAYGSEAVYRGGLTVYTTLNLRMQSLAQRSLEQGLAAAEDLVRQSRRGGAAIESSLRLQGALVALDARTGAILAMVGGRSFRESEFNRAVQAHRQPGSSFKPIIYTTALLNGFNCSDLLSDIPRSYPGKDGRQWTPANFERTQKGPPDISLRRALTLSHNVATADLLNRIGVYTVTSEAKKFGYAGPLRNDLTLALGTSEVSLLEMASAFSVFANGGARAVPFAIKLVKDDHGTVLEQHAPQLLPVISPQIAYLMVSMMEDVIDHGTGIVIRRLGFTRPAGGKTGSTNDFTDAWFVGYTPSVVCAVWVGYDDRRTMGKNMTGGLIAAPIWASFMSEALESAPREDFTRPSGLVTAVVDPASGKLATKACPRTRVELYLEGQAPTQPCTAEERPESFGSMDMTRGTGTSSVGSGSEGSSTPVETPKALPPGGVEEPGAEEGF